ncbi:MAG: CgeB family protein [Candidatus Binataceae bacterium]
MRILYFETTAYYPSSAHFLEALHELAGGRGWTVDFFDEAPYARRRSFASRVAARIIGRRPPHCSALNREFTERAINFRPDLVLIGKGQYLAPRTLGALKRATGAVMVNWATDDPFNPMNSSAGVRASIPIYDLYACTKHAIMTDVKAHGCSEAIYVRFGYKTGVHFPEAAASAEEARRFECDVAFIGGADADRAPIFEALVRALPALRLNLYGGYWERYPALKPYARGIVAGREYRLALAGAAIAINLVRRSNRDDHVMRTFELPACGAFVLAERTSTHEELFAQGREAAFFSDAAELIEEVRRYLADADGRRRIAEAGRCKVLTGHHTYADRLLQIVDAAVPIVAARGLKMPRPCAAFPAND